MDEAEPRLTWDRLLAWDGAHPYEAMHRFGITPSSSAREVLDASFDMTPDDLRDAALNQAWELLRRPASRLLVDFFCYHLPEPAAPRGVAQAGDAPALPLPWAFLHALAFAAPPVGLDAPRVKPPAMPATLSTAPPWWLSVSPGTGVDARGEK
jgi:hypothetical protein